MATTRIGGGRKPHLYITEHMNAAGATNASIATRLDIHRATVGKWLSKVDRLSVDQLNQLAYALDLDDWRELTFPPGYQSVDMVLQDAPALREAVVEFAKRLKASNG